MNTATYRSMARKAELAMDWSTAAMFYRKAIEKYPTRGALAARDLEGLKIAAGQCERMARYENGQQA